MKIKTFTLSQWAIICEILGIILLLLMLFTMKPILLTLGLPIGIGFVALGILLWFIAIFKLEGEEPKQK